MSEVVIGAITGVFVAAMGVIPAWLTFRQAKAARLANDDVEQRKLNQADFELFRSAVREDYLRLRSDLDQERANRKVIIAWGKSVWAYVGSLQTTMRAHNVQVPPAPSELETFPWETLDV